MNISEKVDVDDLILDVICNEDSDDANLFDSSSSDESENTETTDSSIEIEATNRRKLARFENYVEEIVISFDGKQFKEHFRMSRVTSTFIIEKLISTNIMPIHKFGREKITAEKAFLMTVWYLANQETFRQISDRFNVTSSAAHRCIRKVVRFLVDESSNFIIWPNAAKSREISNEFEKLHNICGVIGAIDGCHINILRPGINQHAYCNRKGSHSILLQGVCDNKKRFIDIFCGEAGSMHDARLLKRSTLYELITQGHLIAEHYFLLGDSAYPNLTWLVAPFKDNGRLTEDQKTFNFRHSSTRIIIENAFGLLKGRFRRLKFFENQDIDFISQATVAACVLHNICINFDDEIDFNPDNNDIGENNICDTQNENFNHNFDQRQQIFNNMFHNV